MPGRNLLRFFRGHFPSTSKIAEILEKRGDYNVFHRVLPRARASALRDRRFALRVLRQCRCGHRRLAARGPLEGLPIRALTENDLETAAFNVFLYGRMIEAAAEIDDHLNRGRNMDTRTPLEQCAFVV
jgi:hypothetical protein